MKVLLTTLNSRYTHMSLSLRYLRAALEQRFSLAPMTEPIFADGSEIPLPHSEDQAPDETSTSPLQVELLEFSINQPHEQMLLTLYEAAPDLICFSVYIWNVEAILKLAASLKQVRPDLRILFGGPEVAYEARVYLENHPFLDAVVTGEGEWILTQYVARMLQKQNENDIDLLDSVPGVVERQGRELLDHGQAEKIQRLDEIPFPYRREDFEAGRILYYEASRGCPYRCAYCLSSREPGVRHFSLERVKRDLDLFLEARVMQVKFVDRTFNVEPQRTQEIFQYLIDHDNGITGFHFEITAALLKDADYEILSKARPGLFQFEIGVQSTCEAAMAAVQRPLPFVRTAEACQRLVQLGNLHLHLDLIAGLPYEGFERFLKSFDDVFELKPHALQLGFLKLIPGSPLTRDAARYGYLREKHPPYEVLGSDHLSYGELVRLKRMEALVGIYFNSHGFTATLNYALKCSGQTASEFFGDMADFFRVSGIDRQAYRSEAHYDHFETYVKSQVWYTPFLSTLLDYDCLTALAKVRRVKEEPQDLKVLLHDVLRSENPEIPVKRLLKTIRYQIMEYDLLAWLEGKDAQTASREGLWLGLVDTSSRSPITERYPYDQYQLR